MEKIINTGKYSPIVLFVYNRLLHTQKTIEYLQKNDLAAESELFIFSDGPRGEQDQEEVNGIREYVHGITGFSKVIVMERPGNVGLAQNIIMGVSEILERYDRVIVLEDDLLTSPYFLRFMNDALEIYKDDDRVGQVNGHVLFLSGDVPDTFFIRFVDSWGWATWSRSWRLFNPDGQELLAKMENWKLCNEFDFDGCYPYTRMLKRQIRGENNSWAIRWNASLFLEKKLALNVGKSLVQNIGFDGTGTHCKKNNLFKSVLYDGKLNIKKENTPVENEYIRRRIGKIYRWRNSKIHKAWIMLLNILSGNR